MRPIETAVIAFALILSTRSGRAGSITYTEKAIGSGSLGGTAFTNDLITLTATADTANIIDWATGYHFDPSPGLFQVVASLATVSVATVGSGTFIRTVDVFNNQDDTTAGFGLSTGDILDIYNYPAFAAYDLSTPIGPVTGPAHANAGDSFATTAGTFNIDRTALTTGTFQATAVPEPSSLIQVGTAALAGLGLWSRRRRVGR